MGKGDAEMNLQDLCNEIMNLFLGTKFLNREVVGSFSKKCQHI